MARHSLVRATHPERKVMSIRPLVPALVAAVIALPLGAADSVPPNPALHTGSGQTAGGESSGGPVHSWELPAITVNGQRSEIKEQDLVGSYGQPRWSASRRFTETRAYVIPEGQIEFEYWLTVEDHPRGESDGARAVKQQYEVEINLPYRFQVDLYQSYEKEYPQEGADGENKLSETKFEVRWALADWDQIWGNPTLYAEWAAVSGDADVAEFKLLLADDLAPRWIWAFNAVYEFAVGGDCFRNYEVTGGLAYALSDSKFSIGVEAKAAWENTKVDRGDFENEIIFGLSIQYRPLNQFHVDLAIMAGLTDESPVTKTVMIAGWEF
ncbi:MAG TPA: hypothetical protein VHX44_05955 [Planctomycetota bacterium]|nr:hypothetical protein [Planctomycetota bacterium]